MMKKTIMLCLVVMLCLGGIANALVLTNPTPADGAYIQGDGTEDFSVDTDVPAVNGMLWVDESGSWNSYVMDCTSGTQCVVTPDLSSYADLTSYTWYMVVDGVNTPAFPGTYSFNIDKVPSVASGVSCLGASETSLLVDWDDHVMSDVVEYDVRRDGVVIDTVNVSELTDTGLITGTPYSYEVLSRDVRGQESGWTPLVTCIPTDMTPPSAPVITEPSPATYATLTPTVTLDYAETVSLRVMSGAVLVEDLGVCMNCVWNPVFTSDGVYAYSFEASDAVGNTRTDSYAVTIDATAVNASVSVSDLIHLLGGDAPTVVKGDAMSTSPNDYWLLSYDLSYYGGSGVRATLADLVSASQTVDIDVDSQPMLFCAEDYDSVSQDFDGTGVTYDIKNSYDVTQPALSCADTDPTGETAFTVYLKIPVPSGLTSDDFELSWEFGLY